MWKGKMETLAVEKKQQRKKWNEIWSSTIRLEGEMEKNVDVRLLEKMATTGKKWWKLPKREDRIIFIEF